MTEQTKHSGNVTVFLIRQTGTLAACWTVTSGIPIAWLLTLVTHCHGTTSQSSTSISCKSVKSGCVGHSGTNGTPKLIPEMFNRVEVRTALHPQILENSLFPSCGDLGSQLVAKFLLSISQHWDFLQWWCCSREFDASPHHRTTSTKRCHQCVLHLNPSAVGRTCCLLVVQWSSCSKMLRKRGPKIVNKEDC